MKKRLIYLIINAILTGVAYAIFGFEQTIIICIILILTELDLINKLNG